MNQLYQKPFPHSYDDNLINSSLLKDIKENWPKNISSKWDEFKDLKVFRLESSESWLEMNDNQIKFWKNFIKVKCFHNYAINNHKKFDLIGVCDDKTMEFYKIKNKKIYGMMWHPERDLIFKNYNKIIIKKICS